MPFAVCFGAAVAMGATTGWFGLEWNPSYDATVPHEVDVDDAKLKAAGVDADCGFTVLADGRAVRTESFPSAHPGRTTVRFRVPAETRSVACRPEGERFAELPAKDNLLDKALSADGLGRWDLPEGCRIQPVAGGVVLSSEREGRQFARFRVPVAPDQAGHAVRFAVTVKNLSSVVWGNVIRVVQLDAAGHELPEDVVDQRWISHMRPVQVETPLQTDGRFHPAARQAVVSIELRLSPGDFGHDGLPVKKADASPRLLVSHLSLRMGQVLPFPKWNDCHFAAGVSGRADDAALHLTAERAFWYQTHSMATWSGFKQLREEKDLFFPLGAGTAEAWFRPDWKPTDGRAFTLFHASLHDNHLWGRKLDLPKDKANWPQVRLSYVPKTGVFDVRLVDSAFRVFEGGATNVALRAGTWSHLALQWTPNGTAEVFANGRRVLSLPLTGWVTPDLDDRKRYPVPSNVLPSEFFVGGSYQAARRSVGLLPNDPLFSGDVDMVRVSSGARYAGDFASARDYGCDAETCAFFSFDRSFDGCSGGGSGFVRGTYRAAEGRTDSVLTVCGKPYRYFPEAVVPAQDPKNVLKTCNYPKLPQVDDFSRARVARTKTVEVGPGQTFDIAAAEGVVSDFVEIANAGDEVLRHPLVVRRGEADPRSFADLADSLGLSALSAYDRCVTIFNYVLGASDYFMSHQPTFAPHSDEARGVTRMALMMLNGYCGFECGPLNNMTANLFACAGGCPASQTAGYGHEFQQVFYDGKNHLWDLSSQTFFPAFDNETAASLEECEDEPGMLFRHREEPSYYIRNTLRGGGAQSPLFLPKIAMTLNPHERFRAWFHNDGTMNDLQLFPNMWNFSSATHDESYAERVHARVSQGYGLWRVDRFFPQYGNGFLVFEGRPEASNPAFAAVTATSFCYRVESCYPIVDATYVAELADGRVADLELSTDGAKTFRSIPAHERLGYSVRARTGYYVRVKAPLSEVRRFCGKTEVMFNSRILPGKLNRGKNVMTLRATSGGKAKVTCGWREPGNRLFVRGALATGALVGDERHLLFLRPGRASRWTVEGASPASRVVASSGLDARLENGMLTVRSVKPSAGVDVRSLEIRDGEAFCRVSVVVSEHGRLALASEARCDDGVVFRPDDNESFNARVVLNRKGRATFKMDTIPAGRYLVLALTRFAAFSDNPRSVDVYLDIPGRKTSCGVSAINPGGDFYKARMGERGGRANWKWSYPLDPRTSYPYQQPNVLELPDTEQVTCCKDASNTSVEIGAVLVLPAVEREAQCRLLKVLCGLNCQPEMVRPD